MNEVFLLSDIITLRPENGSLTSKIFHPEEYVLRFFRVKKQYLDIV